MICKIDRVTDRTDHPAKPRLERGNEMGGVLA